jgi:hypothetical protein
MTPSGTWQDLSKELSMLALGMGMTCTKAKNIRMTIWTKVEMDGPQQGQNE